MQPFRQTACLRSVEYFTRKLNKGSLLAPKSLLEAGKGRQEVDLLAQHPKDSNMARLRSVRVRNGYADVILDENRDG